MHAYPGDQASVLLTHFVQTPHPSSALVSTFPQHRLIRVYCRHREPLFAIRTHRDDVADSQVLQLRDNSPGAWDTQVIDPIVAIPTCAFASDLNEPWPYIPGSASMVTARVALNVGRSHNPVAGHGAGQFRVCGTTLQMPWTRPEEVRRQGGCEAHCQPAGNQNHQPPHREFGQRVILHCSCRATPAFYYSSSSRYPLPSLRHLLNIARLHKQSLSNQER